MTVSGNERRNASDLAIGRGALLKFGTYRLFYGQYFILGFFFLVVQQIIVATSVYFLAQAAENLSDSKLFTYNFVLFVLSLVLPYIPGALSHYCFDIWSISAIKQFQDFSSQHHPFESTDFVKSDLGAERNALFSNTAPSTISDFCYYTVELMSTFLNSFFSIAVIASVVDYKIALSYAASLLGCAIYTTCFSNLAAEKSEKAEVSRVALLAHNEKMWPNLSLGNVLSELNWRRVFEEKYSGYIKMFRKERRLIYLSTIVLSLISVLPTAITIIYLAIKAHGNLTLLSAMLVSAPRVFQLLTMLGQFSSLIFGWNHVRGRLDALGDFFVPLMGIKPKIDFKAISLMENGMIWEFADLDRLIHIISTAKSGRFILRGRNGSGKTTLLLHVKKTIGDKAFFLPPASGLCFNQSLVHLSTGQKKLLEIETLIADHSNEYLLLDEWDGNLDTENVELINAAIGEAAKTRVIVEIRHRYK